MTPNLFGMPDQPDQIVEPGTSYSSSEPRSDNGLSCACSLKFWPRSITRTAFPPNIRFFGGKHGRRPMTKNQYGEDDKTISASKAAKKDLKKPRM